MITTVAEVPKQIGEVAVTWKSVILTQVNFTLPLAPAAEFPLASPLPPPPPPGAVPGCAIGVVPLPPCPPTPPSPSVPSPPAPPVSPE